MNPLSGRRRRRGQASKQASSLLGKRVHIRMIRSDFEMTGIPGTDYYKDDRLAEFKYFKAKFPLYQVRSCIVYICANKGWKCREVTL